MKINFKKESWHSKYYRFMLNQDPPKSLCPYFWALVGSTLVFPMLLTSKYLRYRKEQELRKRDNWTPEQRAAWQEAELEKEMRRVERSKKYGKVASALWFTFIGSMLVFGLYSMIQKEGLLQTILVFSVAFSIAFLILFLIYAVVVKNKLDFLADTFVVKFFGGMAVAIYRKACPVIEWEEEKEKTKKDEN